MSGHFKKLTVPCLHDKDYPVLAIAAEPRWLEIPREELNRRKNALGYLMTKLVNRNTPILTDDEVALLESIWQMHVDLLD